MAHLYRYQRPTEHLEYYLHFEYKGSPPPPDVQLPHVQDLVPVRLDDPLTFADGETDIRRFAVNTPNGNTLGSVVGFLVDEVNNIVPFAYVRLSGEHTVVVPTDQLTLFVDRSLVTLEGGLEALRGAPKAAYDYTDAPQASRYWIEYRQRHAA